MCQMKRIWLYLPADSPTALGRWALLRIIAMSSIVLLAIAINILVEFFTEIDDSQNSVENTPASWILVTILLLQAIIVFRYFFKIPDNISILGKQFYNIYLRTLSIFIIPIIIGLLVESVAILLFGKDPKIIMAIMFAFIAIFYLMIAVKHAKDAREHFTKASSSGKKYDYQRSQKYN